MSTDYQSPNQPYILFTTNVGPEKKTALGIGTGKTLLNCYDNCIGVVPPEHLPLEITEKGIIDKRSEIPREYDHEILDIRKNAKDVYLVNYDKDRDDVNILWNLPEYVRTFLFPEFMGITFIDGKLYIVKTAGDILAWKTPVTILTEEYGEHQKVSVNQDKELEKSYFTKNGSKFFFHKCIIRLREGKLAISSQSMDKYGNLECKNLECVLGFAPLPDNYD
jgi:hypothetical protein